MNSSNSRLGFTVIEVVLALTISLALMAALMQTVQVSINRQRYHDTLYSFQDFLRRQYEQVGSVNVDKTNGTVADIKTIGINDCYNNNEAGNYGYGRSNCVLVGRLINLRNANDRGVVRTRRVYYYQEDDASAGSFENFFSKNKNNQSSLASNFNDLIAVSDRVSQTELEWDSVLRRPDSNLLTATILILKSPVDGTIRTFSSYGDLDIKDVIDKTEQLDFCIHPSSNPYGPIRSVRLRPSSSNQTGVELTSVDPSQGGVRCQ